LLFVVFCLFQHESDYVLTLPHLAKSAPNTRMDGKEFRHYQTPSCLQGGGFDA
jgi:hypothetical protein